MEKHEIARMETLRQNAESMFLLAQQMKATAEKTVRGEKEQRLKNRDRSNRLPEKG